MYFHTKLPISLIFTFHWLVPLGSKMAQIYDHLFMGYHQQSCYVSWVPCC